MLKYEPTDHVYGCECRSCRATLRARTRAARQRSRSRFVTWGFPEEYSPTGTNAFRVIYSGMCAGLSDYSDLLAARVASRPWFLILWEPLRTKAPSPAIVRPWCCYIRTVIFYQWPHTVLSTRRGFAYYDQIETRISHDALIEFEGETFKYGHGQVLWKRGRWWMRSWFRRERKE